MSDHGRERTIVGTAKKNEHGCGRKWLNPLRNAAAHSRMTFKKAGAPDAPAFFVCFITAEREHVSLKIRGGQLPAATLIMVGSDQRIHGQDLSARPIM